MDSYRSSPQKANHREHRAEESTQRSIFFVDFSVFPQFLRVLCASLLSRGQEMTIGNYAARHWKRGRRRVRPAEGGQALLGLVALPLADRYLSSGWWRRVPLREWRLRGN